MRRRGFLGGLAALPFAGIAPALAATAHAARAAEARYPQVSPDYRLRFPRDHGAHPEYRTEWWYVTGWLRTGGGEELGFQVTFFRSRPPFESANPSRFAPGQILLAHAALADPKHGRLRHDQRAARAALGLAGFRDDTTGVWIDDWRLELDGARYRARIAARDFTLELEFAAPGTPLAQGADGFSRKGPRPAEASHYYSRPQLKVAGSVSRGGAVEAVSGLGWLDHEWSSQFMAPEAAGWDWVGVNLDDGGALMAFRMRARDGGTYYAGGTLVSVEGEKRVLAPGEVAFTPLRRWRSPRTGVEYPVAMRVVCAGIEWRLEPLLDDQELDSRASTGTIYWEGAVRAFRDAHPAGRGYLELTGYWRPMRI